MSSTNPNPVAVMAPDRFSWEVCIRGADVTLAERAVAHTMASYGNRHGKRIFPGVQNIMDDLQCHKNTVLRALKGLEDKGWLRCLKRGRKNSGSSEYVLTIPVDHVHKMPNRAVPLPPVAQPKASPKPKWDQWNLKPSNYPTVVERSPF